MSEDGEKRGGGLATTVGVVGGAAVAAGVSSRKVLNKNIVAAATGGTAPEKVATKVTEAIGKGGTELAGKAEALKVATAGADKALIKTAEKDLITGVRANTKFGMGEGLKTGFKGLSGGGKARVIGGVVAGAVVGGIVLNKIFGGKHTKRVEAERQVQQDMGMVR